MRRKVFVDSLNAQLEPKLSGTTSEASLQKFRSQFDDISFHKGLEVDFTCMNGEVTTKVDGKKLGKVKDAALSEALVNIYLGDQAVSQSAKEAFGRGIYKMVTQART